MGARVNASVGIVAASLALAGCGSSEAGSGTSGDVVEISFAHTAAVPQTVWEDTFTEELPQRLEDATDGAVEIRVIRDAIGSDDVLSEMKGGKVGAGDLILNYVAGTYPEWGVFGLPGLLTHEDEEVMAGLFTDVIKPKVAEMTEERFGVTPLIVSAFPENRWWTTETKLQSVDDMKGLKIRTNSPETTALAKALGAAPVGTEFSELYPSLEQGIVEAATSSTAPIYGSSIHEVLNYVHFLPGGISTYAAFIAKDTLESLPADVKESLLSEVEEMQNEAWQNELDRQEEYLDEMKEAGVEVVEVDDRFYDAVLRTAKDEVWSSWEKNVGPEGSALLEEIQTYLSEAS
jgi:TRAP-type C4-dicarboxylate transport system substrate-binding protein